MKPPDCPRLARQEAILRAMYQHLTKGYRTRLRKTHYCPDCPGAWRVPPHLSREPEDQP